MKLPTSSGERLLRATISSRFETYTLERPSKTTGPMGGSESTSTVTADIWVFDPQEIREDTEYGDRLTGSLGGLTSPTADVSVNDRLSYHGETYEVAETMLSDGAEDVYMLLDLVRVVNTDG